MNGSKAADMGCVPSPGDGGAIKRWAEVRKAMREARKSVLIECGLNEDSLKRLEEAALEEMQKESGEVDTGSGIVSIAYHQAFLHKNSQEYGQTPRLYWRESKS